MSHKRFRFFQTGGTAPSMPSTITNYRMGPGVTPIYNVLKSGEAKVNQDGSTSGRNTPSKDKSQEAPDYKLKDVKGLTYEATSLKNKMNEALFKIQNSVRTNPGYLDSPEYLKDQQYIYELEAEIVGVENRKAEYDNVAKEVNQNGTVSDQVYVNGLLAVYDNKANAVVYLPPSEIALDTEQKYSPLTKNEYLRLRDTAPITVKKGNYEFTINNTVLDDIQHNLSEKELQEFKELNLKSIGSKEMTPDGKIPVGDGLYSQEEIENFFTGKGSTTTNYSNLQAAVNMYRTKLMQNSRVKDTYYRNAYISVQNTAAYQKALEDYTAKLAKVKDPQEQAALKNRFSSLINSFITDQIDYQMNLEIATRLNVNVGKLENKLDSVDASGSGESEEKSKSTVELTNEYLSLLGFTTEDLAVLNKIDNLDEEEKQEFIQNKIDIEFERRKAKGIKVTREQVEKEISEGIEFGLGGIDAKALTTQAHRFVTTRDEDTNSLRKEPLNGNAYLDRMVITADATIAGTNIRVMDMVEGVGGFNAYMDPDAITKMKVFRAPVRNNNGTLTPDYDLLIQLNAVRVEASSKFKTTKDKLIAKKEQLLKKYGLTPEELNDIPALISNKKDPELVNQLSEFYKEANLFEIKVKDYESSLRKSRGLPQDKDIQYKEFLSATFIVPVDDTGAMESGYDFLRGKNPAHRNLTPESAEDPDAALAFKAHVNVSDRANKKYESILKSNGKERYDGYDEAAFVDVVIPFENTPIAAGAGTAGTLVFDLKANNMLSYKTGGVFKKPVVGKGYKPFNLFN